MDNYGLSTQILKLILNVFANNNNVTNIKIFGSRAKGNYKPNSDIDLVVWGTLTPIDLEELKQELEYLPTPYEFDLINYETITHEKLKAHIDRVAKPLNPITTKDHNPHEQHDQLHHSNPNHSSHGLSKTI